MAEAPSAVAAMEGDTCECKSLDSSPEKPKQSRSSLVLHLCESKEIKA